MLTPEVLGVNTLGRRRAFASFLSDATAEAEKAQENTKLTQEDAIKMKEQAMHAQELANHGHRVFT